MKHSQVMEMTIQGIKCDGEDCDYRDDEVDRESYTSYINKPCPKCGGILLTQADYDTVIQLEEMVFCLNLNVSDILTIDTEISTFDVEMDGSGISKLGEIKAALSDLKDTTKEICYEKSDKDTLE